jgi:hypothetical protein
MRMTHLDTSFHERFLQKELMEEEFRLAYAAAARRLTDNGNRTSLEDVLASFQVMQDEIDAAVLEDEV